MVGVIRATRRGRGERGSALAEAALSILLLIVIVFGIIDFGRAMYAYHAVSNGAELGTRYALVRGYDSGISVAAAAVDSYVKSGIVLDPSQVTVTTTWQDNQKAGTWVRVQVDYNFQFLLPVSTITLSSHSQMVIAR